MIQTVMEGDFETAKWYINSGLNAAILYPKTQENLFHILGGLFSSSLHNDHKLKDVEQFVILLLQKGLDINQEDHQKNTPLLAGIGAISETEFIKLLLSYGACIPEDEKIKALEKEGSDSQLSRVLAFKPLTVDSLVLSLDYEKTHEKTVTLLNICRKNQVFLKKKIEEKNWDEIKIFIKTDKLKEYRDYAFNCLTGNDKSSVLEALFELACTLDKGSEDFNNVKEILTQCKNFNIIKPIPDSPSRKELIGKARAADKEDIVDLMCFEGQEEQSSEDEDEMSADTAQSTGGNRKRKWRSDESDDVEDLGNARKRLRTEFWGSPYQPPKLRPSSDSPCSSSSQDEGTSSNTPPSSPTY